LEPGSFAQLLRFIADGGNRYDESLKKFVGRNFYTSRGHKLRFFKALEA